MTVYAPSAIVLVRGNKQHQTPMKPTKFCFSYIRFSSAKQAKGSSVERQSEIAPRVAMEMGWTLRPEWNAQNLGVSAFKGDNIKTIEAIIEAVKQGKIPQGSVLIIEALDRLTRLDLDQAQDLLRRILRSGLEIYTDTKRRHLTKDSLKSLSEVIATACELDAAFDYGDKLANRTGGGLNKIAREVGEGKVRPLGTMMPDYLKVRDGKWVLDEKTIAFRQWVFDSYLKLGSLNRVAVEVNTTHKQKHIWKAGDVRQVLTARSSIGEFSLQVPVMVDGKVKRDSEGKRITETKVVSNYFPAIVSESQFKQVQVMLKAHRKNMGGSGNNVTCIFNGLAKCVCGGFMLAVPSTSRSGKMHSYYKCGNSRIKACTHVGSFKTPEVELDFIKHFLKQNPLDLFAKNTPQVQDNTASIKAEIAVLQEAIDAKVSLCSIKSAVAQATIDIGKLEVELNAKQAELEHASIALQSIEETPKALMDVQTIVKNMVAPNHQGKGVWKYSLTDLGNKVYDAHLAKQLQDPETRKRLKTILPSLVKRITFDAPNSRYCVTKHDGTQSKWFQVVK